MTELREVVMLDNQEEVNCVIILNRSKITEIISVYPDENTHFNFDDLTVKEQNRITNLTKEMINV